MANEAINASAGRQTATSTMTAPRSPCCRCVYRSEEHTSELQSQSNLVCRLLLEKKKRYHDREVRDMQVSTQYVERANEGMNADYSPKGDVVRHIQAELVHT